MEVDKEESVDVNADIPWIEDDDLSPDEQILEAAVDPVYELNPDQQILEAADDPGKDLNPDQEILEAADDPGKDLNPDQQTVKNTIPDTSSVPSKNFFIFKGFLSYFFVS